MSISSKAAAIVVIWLGCLSAPHAQRRSMADMAATNPELAAFSAQILNAAEHRDFAMLMPLFARSFYIDQERYPSTDELQTRIQNWPEDFGPSFWRDLRDIVQAGVFDQTAGGAYVWRRPGARLGLDTVDIRTLRPALQIAEFVRDAKPRTKIMPVDLAASDPDLVRVRDQLVRATDRRDPDLLASIIAPKIQVTFDEPITGTDFVARLKACALNTCDEVWQDLHDAIRFGMAKTNWDGPGMVAPYTFEKIGDDPDSLAIAGSRVALHGAPALDAPVLEWLSYDLVKVVDPTTADATDWQEIRAGRYGYYLRHVRTPSGHTGWVSSEFARSGFDVRAWFKKIDGVWKLVALIGGD
ncbi:MAG TPA: SH3 domain-containing protein [Vicinamibacterales bacterium]|nr:SH3 domain-containing protein [Vicinamibacterales bacterium]